MPSSADLVCINPKDVHKFWPHVAPLLRKAIERVGLCDFAAVEDEALDGGSLVWIAWADKIEAAAITTIQGIAGERVCVLTACGGENMRNWLPLLEKIEQYAKAENCVCVRIFGREGWLRVLNGYQKKAIVIERQFHGR